MEKSKMANKCYEADEIKLKAIMANCQNQGGLEKCFLNNVLSVKCPYMGKVISLDKKNPTTKRVYSIECNECSLYGKK